MKTLIQKIARVTLLALVAMPMLAHATDRRPDIQFNVVNYTNQPVTFRSDTSCADMPSFTVAPRSSFSYWGEPMNHGSCTYDDKRISLSVDKYGFELYTYAMPDYTMATWSKSWKHKITNSSPNIGIGDAHYDGNDLILQLTVSE